MQCRAVALVEVCSYSETWMPYRSVIEHIATGPKGVAEHPTMHPSALVDWLDPSGNAAITGAVA
jgi:hypothetical protein